MTRDVYISGGSGYVGASLIGQLLARGHRVRALVRPGPERKLPQGCAVLVGDPFHPAIAIQMAAVLVSSGKPP